MSSSIRDRAAAAVAARGGRLELDGDRAAITIDGMTVSRPIEIVASHEDFRALSRPGARAGLGQKLVLLDTASPQRARLLRDSGAWFVDTVGRILVRAPGLVVDVDRPPRSLGHGEVPPSRPRTARRVQVPAMNLMSPVRAQVVCALLAWPDLAGAPVRELARAAGTSFGVAAQVSAALRDDGYIARRPARVLRPDDLLDAWTASFPRGLGAHLELRRFAGEPTTTGWTAAGHAVDLSGEAAVDGVDGPDLVLYVAELDPLAVVRSRWRTASYRDANIVVRRRFWTAPRDAPADGLVSRAPTPLVMADLVADRDSRHLEAVSTLRKEIVDRLQQPVRDDAPA